jgi:hypothetical protein
LSGQYCAAGSTAITCPIGSYCPTPSTVITCGSGWYCPAGSTSQTACPAGYFCPDPSTKTICPIGHYCPTGSTSAISCPSGYYRTTTGGQSVNDCAACRSACANYENEAVPCSTTTDRSCSQCAIEYTCSGSDTVNSNKQCVVEPTCTTGYVLTTVNSKRSCVPQNIYSSCSSGSPATINGVTKCVLSSITPTCTSPDTLTNDGCLRPSTLCPTGGSYNSTYKVCISPPPALDPNTPNMCESGSTYSACSDGCIYNLPRCTGCRNWEQDARTGIECYATRYIWPTCKSPSVSTYVGGDLTCSFPLTCPDGYTWIGGFGKGCVKPACTTGSQSGSMCTIESTCPSGYTLSNDKSQCIPNPGGTLSCPRGTFNGFTCEIGPATQTKGVCCSTSQRYDPNTRQCVNICPAGDTGTTPTYTTGTCTVTTCTATDNNGTATKDASDVCRLTCKPGYSKNASGVCMACLRDTGTTATYTTGTCTVTTCTATDTNGTAANDASGVCRLTCKPGYGKNASGVCTTCPGGDTGTTATYTTGTCTVTTCTATDTNGTAAKDASGVCRLTCKTGYGKNASGVCAGCPAGDTGTTATYTTGTCTVTTCTATDTNGTAAKDASGVCRLTCKSNYTKNSSRICVYCPDGYTKSTTSCSGYPLCSVGWFIYDRNRCESTSNYTCPSGTTVSTVYTVPRCIGSSPPSCTPISGRTVNNANVNGVRKCITEVLPTCTAGGEYQRYSYNSSTNTAQCSTTAYANIQCPAGTTLYGSGCVTGSGACCTDAYCTVKKTPTCPSTYTLSYEGSYCGYRCTKLTTVTQSNWCPTGAIPDPTLRYGTGSSFISMSAGNGQCIYDYGAPVCASGTSQNTDGQCVAPVGCSGGGIIDSTLGVCYYTTTCPTNDFTRSSSTKLCTRNL